MPIVRINVFVEPGMSNKQVLKLALEALEEIHVGNMTPMAEANWNKAINAIKEALAQPEQEPVAWMCSDFNLMHRGYSRFSPTRQGEWSIPVYTTPPQREWVGLTEEEIDTWNIVAPSRLRDFVRCIEAKLREKNG